MFRICRNTTKSMYQTIRNTDIWMTMSACYKLSELLQPNEFPKNEKTKIISFKNIRKLSKRLRIRRDTIK